MGANRGNNKPYLSRIRGRGATSPHPPFCMLAWEGCPQEYFFIFQNRYTMQIILWSIFLVIVHNWIFDKKDR